MNEITPFSPYTTTSFKGFVHRITKPFGRNEQDKKTNVCGASILLVAVHKKDICFIFILYINFVYDILMYMPTTNCNYLCFMLISIDCM